MRHLHTLLCEASLTIYIVCMRLFASAGPHATMLRAVTVLAGFSFGKRGIAGQTREGWPSERAGFPGAARERMPEEKPLRRRCVFGPFFRPA